MTPPEASRASDSTLVRDANSIGFSISTDLPRRRKSRA
jgi:hypothetical protein